MRLWTETAQEAASARGLSRPEFLSIVPEHLRALAEADSDHLGSRRRALCLFFRSEGIPRHLPAQGLLNSHSERRAAMKIRTHIKAGPSGSCTGAGCQQR